MKEIFDSMRDELKTLKKLIINGDSNNEKEVEKECDVIKTENENQELNYRRDV